MNSSISKNNISAGFFTFSGLSGSNVTVMWTSWPSCTVCGKHARYSLMRYNKVFIMSTDVVVSVYTDILVFYIFLCYHTGKT